MDAVSIHFSEHVFRVGPVLDALPCGGSDEFSPVLFATGFGPYAWVFAQFDGKGVCVGVEDGRGLHGCGWVILMMQLAVFRVPAKS